MRGVAEGDELVVQGEAEVVAAQGGTCTIAKRVVVAAVIVSPKTGFRSSRMPARRKRRVAKRRTKWDEVMMEFLDLQFQCVSGRACLPVACVIDVV